jgi:hypothetical protein
MLGIMTRISIILLFAVFLCASCESPEQASRRQEQREQSIEQARLRVLDQLPNLDGASREMIRTNAPRIEYVGAPFGGSYWLCWAISSNRTAVLGSFMRFEDLQNERVTIREPLPPSHY